MTIDDIDRRILAEIQGDIPVNPRPFKVLADKLDLDENEVITRIVRLEEQGIIRRLAAVLRHRDAGYVVNAMVAWKVEPDRLDQVGESLAKFSAVSHCYDREVPLDFGYNLFSMIHARSQEELTALIQEMKKVTGISDYQVIPTIREFKKLSMKYF